MIISLSQARPAVTSSSSLSLSRLNTAAAAAAATWAPAVLRGHLEQSLPDFSDRRDTKKFLIGEIMLTCRREFFKTHGPDSKLENYLLSKTSKLNPDFGIIPLFQLHSESMTFHHPVFCLFLLEELLLYKTKLLSGPRGQLGVFPGQ